MYSKKVSCCKVLEGKAYLVADLSVLEEQAVKQEELLALGLSEVLDILRSPDCEELVVA